MRNVLCYIEYKLKMVKNYLWIIYSSSLTVANDSFSLSINFLYLLAVYDLFVLVFSCHIAREFFSYDLEECSSSSNEVNTQNALVDFT